MCSSLHTDMWCGKMCIIKDTKEGVAHGTSEKV
nr:MAG TPA: hypothetical protein [Caudoviricetes sp.]